MRFAVLLLLCGCSPLAGFSHTFGPIKEAVGKSEMAEVYTRLAARERLQAGYPDDQRRGIQPCRAAFAGPKCPE